MSLPLGVAVEVTRSSATIASTLAGGAAAVAFAALGALVVVVRRTRQTDPPTGRIVCVAAAVVLLTTGVEFGAYLVEQVRLTADTVPAVASSTRSLIVAARVMAVGVLLVVRRGRRDTGSEGAGAWDVALLVTALAAVATALLDPVGAPAWRSAIAVGLGAVGAELVLRFPSARGAVPILSAGGAVAAVAVVLLGGVGDGWSGRVSTDVGAFEVSVLPAAPDALNEVHVIGQPGSGGRLPDLTSATIVGDRVRGPDPAVPPGEPFELFLVSPDHAIAYGLEVQGDGPWIIDLGLRTADGDADVRLEVERP